MINKYIVLTLHRPSNVDNKVLLNQIINKIALNCENAKIVFPVHPRTKKKLSKTKSKNIHFIDPLSYFEFNYLVKNSIAVITDSGGITEETTVLGVPCITLRDNTERPETVKIGTNELIGSGIKNIKKNLKKLILGNWKKGSIPELWDGKTAERIISHILKFKT